MLISTFESFEPSRTNVTETVFFELVVFEIVVVVEMNVAEVTVRVVSRVAVVKFEVGRRIEFEVAI